MLVFFQAHQLKISLIDQSVESKIDVTGQCAELRINKNYVIKLKQKIL